METVELIDLLEACDCEPRPYSGRGMYGKHCVAVTCGSVNGLFADISYAMKQMGNLEQQLSNLENLLRTARTDNLGRDTVVYWPDMEWEGMEDEE